MHEAIEPTGNTIYSDIEIEHHSIKTAYSRRNLAIYEKQIKDNEPLQPRDVFITAESFTITMNIIKL